jgi:hypothetical protein
MSSFVIISKFCYSQQGSHSMDTKRPKLLFGSHETSPIARTGDTVLVESREMTFRGRRGKDDKKYIAPLTRILTHSLYVGWDVVIIQQRCTKLFLLRYTWSFC